MQVPNDEWVIIGSGGQFRLVVQNVGDVRIGFLLREDAPPTDPEDEDYIPIDSDQHGLLLPGMGPITITGLDTAVQNMYVRALGPRDGQLYFNAASA